MVGNKRLSSLWVGIFFMSFLGFINTASAAEGNGFDAVLGKAADELEEIVFYSVPINGVSLPIVLFLLGGTAVFLTIYFKFIISLIAGWHI